MGDPVWYEVAEETGRKADWHGQPNAGNLLFLDGSVRFLTVRPRRIVGPILFDPAPVGSPLAAPRPGSAPVDAQP
jgi:prepilin-type processing-associated H-X9-DG protein